ncbi:LodA/GoxA family CTQ-dependent oxidase [Methyloversatilis sp. XJ19-13]|uniref:LodA/GoxA family CTQ-dependent oxidase n=1 Tax=Methyloversatilis sp. XJ19-13 TaxID=2963430 RepID=UPI00211C6060|nr:LodA/GoxA family CTQ-dependent oxidase [Methyloversatilis sp. XJ19-13]MCQ9376077.1 LodA/GoxA family CTQ-dependent oxidase [Methyloversatilis sp. XJ19-13]
MHAEDIQSLSIHPSIGIARIGNAPDAWFLAAEVRGGVPEDPDGYRISGGMIKRQVPRFRVYASLKSGEVREVTAAEGRLTWRVQVANLKAGWYQFHFAMDLDTSYVDEPQKRNMAWAGQARDSLNIRPATREISGPNQHGAQYRFDDGTFFGKRVYLGELQTDEAGRLLFLGGVGVSEPRLHGARPTTFANNDGWHDDTCDGPVRARFEIDGQFFEAKPAHVVVAPPNFGPGLFGVVTMDDVVRDLYIRQGWIDKPTSTSFSEDIWPIFDRMSAHQWVNDGVLLLAGQGTPLDARDPAVITRLANTSSQVAAFREAVLALFRPQPPQDQSAGLPPFYGDTFGDSVDAALEYLPVTETQYAHLRRWAEGRFASDWTGIPQLPVFDALTPEQQIEELDRASMHECLGGPFHPGIELTWPFRLATMWEAPYRLRTLPEGEPVRQDYGPVLTKEVALAHDGPHGASGPGSLTRWLGVPWQTDEASCNSADLYTPSLYLSSPSFWGARVPNQVMPAEALELAILPGQPELQRQRHFSNRRLWLRDIQGRGYLERIDSMVSQWWRLGMVEAKSPPPGIGLPDPCFVETGRWPRFSQGDFTLKLARDVTALYQHEPPAPVAGPTRASVAEPEPTFKRFNRGEI